METPFGDERLNKLDEYVADGKNKPEINRAWYSGDLSEIQKRFPDLNILGLGHESLVILDPDDPESVLSFPVSESVHNPKGVLPFSETYNVNRLLKILYPDNIPTLRRISGLDTRYTKREYVQKGHNPKRNYMSVSASQMNAELENMGIKVWIDTGTNRNFILSEDGNVKYVDLPVSQFGVIKKIDKNELFSKIEEVYSNKGEEEVSKQKRQAETYLRRLAELRFVNAIFKKLRKGGFDEQEMSDTVSKFTYDNNSSVTGHEDELSRKRIGIILNKAKEAIQSGKYEYEENRWKKQI